MHFKRYDSQKSLIDSDSTSLIGNFFTFKVHAFKIQVIYRFETFFQRNRTILHLQCFLQKLIYTFLIQICNYLEMTFNFEEIMGFRRNGISAHIQILTDISLQLNFLISTFNIHHHGVFFVLISDSHLDELTVTKDEEKSRMQGQASSRSVVQVSIEGQVRKLLIFKGEHQFRSTNKTSLL